MIIAAAVIVIAALAWAIYYFIISDPDVTGQIPDYKTNLSGYVSERVC